MKAWIGGLVWLALATFGVLSARNLSPEARYSFARTQTECWRGIIVPSPTLEASFPRGTHFELGNGVFTVLEGQLLRIGEVATLTAHSDELRVTMLLDSAHVEFTPTAGCRAIRRTQGNSLLFALKTLLPARRWHAIQEEWDRFRRQHARAIVQAFEPVIPRLLQEAGQVLGGEVKRILENRRPEIQQLLDRYGNEIARERLVPLMMEEVWPIVVQHFRSPTETIGRQIWERVPLFQLAWRAAADKVLDDRPTRTEARWKAFLSDEALPLVEANQDLLRVAAEGMFRDIVRDPEIRAETRELSGLLLEDPALRQLLADVLRDLATDSPRLRDFLREQWEDPRLRPHFDDLNQRLQIFFDRVGNMIFLDEQGQGINPDLARLLRIFLLRRDRQYIFLELAPGEPLEPGEAIEGRENRQP